MRYLDGDFAPDCEVDCVGGANVEAHGRSTVISLFDEMHPREIRLVDAFRHADKLGFVSRHLQDVAHDLIHRWARGLDVSDGVGEHCAWEFEDDDGEEKVGAVVEV